MKDRNICYKYHITYGDGCEEKLEAVLYFICSVLQDEFGHVINVSFEAKVELLVTYCNITLPEATIKVNNHSAKRYLAKRRRMNSRSRPLIQFIKQWNAHDEIVNIEYANPVAAQNYNPEEDDDEGKCLFIQ